MSRQAAIFSRLWNFVTPKQGFSCEFSATCVATGIPSELGVYDPRSFRREVETDVKVTTVRVLISGWGCKF